MTAKPILEVKHLTTQLNLASGKVNVVDDVSFDISLGETIGIVGESGSGKSMTASSIMGVLPKEVASVIGGSILYKGEDLLKMSNKEFRTVRGKKIGMILQDPHTSLNPVYTCGNQLIEAIKILGGEKQKTGLRERAIKLLQSVRISDPEDRMKNFPHQISGGMKQRVVGAISISGQPEVLIADEPTTALDVTIQLQYLELLKQLQEMTGMALIFITHDFGIVARLCDKILVMYAGKVVEFGTIYEVFDNPAHPYTGALLASVPDVKKKTERLVAIPGQPPTVTDHPEGCPFSPRCKHVHSRCSTMPPDFVCEGSKGDTVHKAACWLLKKE